jgi:predicted metalloprotease with PDZ domain
VQKSLPARVLKLTIQKHMRPFKIITTLIFVFSSAAGWAQCNFGLPSSQHELNYSFEPIISQDNLSLRVTLEFESARSGKTTLILPSEWAGQKEAYKSVTELAALSPGTTIKETSEPAKREVLSKRNSPVRLSYILVKQWNGPLNSATRFYADLAPEYFHLIGLTSLVHPKLSPFKPAEVHFDWSKLPKEWSVATSFATDDLCQTAKGSWHDALNSLFVAGDYRIYHRTVAGNAVNFAIRGKWSFTDEEWTSKVCKIVETERKFWHDNNFPYFLVTLTPFGGDRGSQGGTALTNAFMEHLSRLDTISPNVLAQISHEEFHSWNPLRMGHSPDPQEPITWFGEGFTRYFEDLMLLRAGLEQFPDYVTSLNTKLRAYEMNEGRDVPLAEFVRRHSVKQSAWPGLEYRRGAVIAAWLDGTIRDESHGRSSLTDLMFYLVQQNADYRRRHGKPMLLSNKRILKGAAKYIHKVSIDRLRQYVERGGSIQLPDDALGPCVQGRIEAIGKFDLGFDRSSITGETKKVIGVKPDSAAYKAGLRDGQQLLGWSIYNGDPTKQVKLTIKTDTGRQVITYLPQGEKVSVQQFILDQGEYSMKPEACSAMFQH